MDKPNDSPHTNSRKIIDPVQLHQITERLFCRLPIHLIHENQRVSVKAFNYQYPHFEIQHHLPAIESRTLLLEKDDNSIMLECAIMRRTEHGTELVKPLRLYLSKRGIRHEKRETLDDSLSFAGVVIHCLPHIEFYQLNAATNSGRDQLIQQYKNAIKGIISNSLVKIELQRHNRFSVRMKKLIDFNLPIFAPMMEHERQGDNLSLPAVPFSEYKQVMRADGLPGDHMGEICEPLRYRGAFIIGFVQVLTHTPANLGQYHSVRQIVRRLENDLDKRGAFPKNPITGKIIDVSPNGIGFNYTTQRNIMSSVSIGDKIVFDARFSPENVTTLSGKVMNVSAQESAMRFGVELEHISEESQAAIKKMIS
ncbi:MAG TPA: PilZ domain-containing protein [Turneriella sp.]|nr:PilZ domain-containing protein [Turneriella sp.]